MDELLSSKKLAVLVLTHNGMHKIPVLLRILQTSLPASVPIVVVENGSTDNTSSFLEGMKGLRVVHTGKNLSPGAALNRGLQTIEPGCAILRMDDDIIPFPGCIPSLMRALHQPSIGIVGATLFSSDGRLQHCGGESYHPTTGREWCVNCLISDEKTKPCSWVSGACMAISAEARCRVPEFDERFPFWFEDIDYCFEVRKVGFTVLFSREAELYHLSNCNIDARPIVRESHTLFSEKWESCLDLWDYVASKE